MYIMLANRLTRLHLYALILAVLWLCLLVVCQGGKTTTIVRHTETTDPQLDGFWSNKTTWTARWVKYWRPKAIYVPLWKKVWTPTIHNEWVPLPNVPNAWDKHEQGHGHGHGHEHLEGHEYEPEHKYEHNDLED